MSVGFDLLVVLIASVVLVKGVNMFIDSVSHLAHRLKISGYTISFLLVAIGTSLPEASVAISSGLSKNTILSFGDAIGSNMALMTIIIAIPAIFGAGLTTRTALNSKDIYYTAMFSILPLTLAVDGSLGRIDGIILLGSYIVYAYIVLKKATGLESIMDSLTHPNLLRNIIEFVISLVLLLGASQLIVRSAIDFSVRAGLELGLIGLTLTAIGTSLPEIAFSIGAINHHAKEEILGDIIGSVVANSTLVLGIAALLYPIDISKSHVGMPAIFFMVLTLLLFLKFARSKEKFDTMEGLVLVGIYVLFVAVEFWLSQHTLSL